MAVVAADAFTFKVMATALPGFARVGVAEDVNVYWTVVAPDVGVFVGVAVTGTLVGVAVAGTAVAVAGTFVGVTVAGAVVGVAVAGMLVDVAVGAGAVAVAVAVAVVVAVAVAVALAPLVGVTVTVGVTVAGALPLRGPRSLWRVLNVFIAAQSIAILSEVLFGNIDHGQAPAYPFE